MADIWQILFLKYFYCKVLKPKKFQICLKGVFHEIFDLHFFHDSNPSRPPDKQDQIFSNSVSITPRYSNFKKLRGVRLRDVHYTAKSSSRVWITPRSQTTKLILLDSLLQEVFIWKKWLPGSWWAWLKCGSEASKTSLVVTTPENGMISDST